MKPLRRSRKLSEAMTSKGLALKHSFYALKGVQVSIAQFCMSDG